MRNNGKTLLAGFILALVALAYLYLQSQPKSTASVTALNTASTTVTTATATTTQGESDSLVSTVGWVDSQIMDYPADLIVTPAGGTNYGGLVYQFPQTYFEGSAISDAKVTTYASCGNDVATNIVIEGVNFYRSTNGLIYDMPGACNDTFILSITTGTSTDVDSANYQNMKNVFYTMVDSFAKKLAAAGNTPSISTTTVSASSFGMSQYSDANFGFSFWYPDNWIVSTASVSNPNKYPGGTIVKQIDVKSGTRLMTVEEVSSPSPSFSITDSSGVGACPVCSTVRYFFDDSTLTWMVVYPNGSTSGNPTASTPQAADTKYNTMGGLHMFAGSQRFGANVIIPLSAQNFVVVTVDGAIATESDNAQALARTIVATNPKAGVVLPPAYQIQTIEAEQDAYDTITGITVPPSVNANK